MSWNVSLTDIAPSEVEAAAAKSYRDFKATYSDDAKALLAMDEQFEAALNVVRFLMPRDVVGEGNINVSLSGHANPDHKPRAGWANDYVMVNVSSVVRAEAPAEAGG
jgi:hypothetical protein